nr:uncharacterized protein LOC109159167 [Ipomoea batatas]
MPDLARWRNVYWRWPASCRPALGRRRGLPTPFGHVVAYGGGAPLDMATALPLEWARSVEAETRALNNAAIKISVEAYEYDIFRSAEEYSNAKLEPPRYDLTEKYTPKRAVVTVVVGPPPSGPSSSTAMRSFPVSARLPTPATKISLGSKKNELPKTGNSGVEALVPTRLPLTETHPASPSGDKETSRTAKQGKEKEVLEV